MGKLLFRFFTTMHAKIFKVTGGRFVGGGTEDGSILVLTHTGARSGKVRDTPLMFIHHNGGYLIVASAGGAHEHPGWYHNLMANPDTTVNIDGESIDVNARDAGTDRGQLWAKIVDAEPRFGSYESRTDRVIPVVVLQPR
jgi:deazaflavin-dependent oxidoreductase (nitroreductase family)